MLLQAIIIKETFTLQVSKTKVKKIKKILLINECYTRISALLYHSPPPHINTDSMDIDGYRTTDKHIYICIHFIYNYRVTYRGIWHAAVQGVTESHMT